jgi:hypothetical protein
MRKVSLEHELEDAVLLQLEGRHVGPDGSSHQLGCMSHPKRSWCQRVTTEHEHIALWRGGWDCAGLMLQLNGTAA